MKFSILSIKNQDVNICVSNNSSMCIYSFLSEIVSDFKYIHKPFLGYFSRALSINFGVRNLVSTEYFILSDVDLVYSCDHIQRLYYKCNTMIKNNEAIRFICYNYNLKPIISYPKFYSGIKKIPFLNRIKFLEPCLDKHHYTQEYVVLDQLDKEDGGYAHGNGLIHLDSFFLIQGYDEELIGYGPEDDLFNTRIGKLNRLIYDNLPDTSTFHLWHPRYNMIQFDENMRIWKEKKAFINNLVNPRVSDLMANITKKEWGVI
jgi:predicted glycosyltransferase involved in capsule biosynthesis